MSSVRYPVQVITQKYITPDQTVDIDYPVVTGVPNAMVQQSINSSIYALINNVINAQFGEYIKVGYQRQQLTVMVTYEVKTNERGVLSLAVSFYFFPYPAAHGLTILKSLTFDVTSGKVFQLGELFKPGSNYIKVISDLISEQIVKRDILLLNPFAGINQNQDYYLADKAIVVYFQLYDITPYAYGFPMFPISLYDLRNLIPDNGILSNLMAD